MPYITAATHGVDGFYEDALKQAENGRVVLYAKISSDAKNDVNSGSLKTSLDKAKEDSTYKNDYYAIAVTSMNEQVSIQTALRWEQGGNLIDAFKLGIKSGMNSVTNAAAELVKNASQGVAEVFNKVSGGNDGGFANSQQRSMNMLMRKYRRKVISAASAYKNYGGSDTTVNLPQLEFTYPAVDFSGSHMKKCYTLLSYLLPINTIKTKEQADKDDKEDLNTEAETEERTAAENNVLNSTYWMYETPPNNYVNPAMGFNSSFLEGTFGLDVGGTFVPDLIPTSVTLVQSRARVLSAKDYENAKNIPHCMDEFYNAATLTYMKCGAVASGAASKAVSAITGNSLSNVVGDQANNNKIPVVVKVYVQFDFAKHITIYDWQSMFFEHINVQGNEYRHDSPLSKFNTGAASKRIIKNLGIL